jgi:hypothetical protein
MKERNEEKEQRKEKKKEKKKGGKGKRGRNDQLQSLFFLVMTPSFRPKRKFFEKLLPSFFLFFSFFLSLVASRQEKYAIYRVELDGNLFTSRRRDCHQRRVDQHALHACLRPCPRVVEQQGLGPLDRPQHATHRQSVFPRPVGLIHNVHALKLHRRERKDEKRQVWRDMDGGNNKRRERVEGGTFAFSMSAPKSSALSMLACSPDSVCRPCSMRVP